MQHVPFAAYFFTQSFLLSFVSSFLRFSSLRKCCGWVWAKEREMSCRPLSNIFVSDFIAFFPQVLFSRNRLSADVVFFFFLSLWNILVFKRRFLPQNDLCIFLLWNVARTYIFSSLVIYNFLLNKENSIWNPISCYFDVCREK
jgi:hypothetical protein